MTNRLETALADLEGIVEVIDRDSDAYLVHIEILTDDAYGPEVSVEAYNDMTADEQEETDEAYIRGIWAEICGDARRHLRGSSAQLTLPGLPEIVSSPTLFEVDDDALFGGGGVLTAHLTIPTPMHAGDDAVAAYTLRMLGGAVRRWLAAENQAKAEVAAVEAAVANEEAAKLEAKRTALLTTEMEERTVLVRVANRPTWQAFQGQPWAKRLGILDRRVFERKHADETAAGWVIGLTPEEWERVNAARKANKSIKVTKLRTKAPAGWVPKHIEDRQL